MASLGKINASVVSGHNENSLALINNNINFALCRIEAPAAFRGLGLTLNENRRKNAEEGPVHQTARKLGALFENVVEIRKTLIDAYGQRVSEISSMEAVNPKGTSKHGFFREQVGADGTGIWAAATSGSSAIAVSMLASMLASLWKGSEATAIWVELVAARKAQIHDQCDGSQTSHFALIEASRQPISRTELAEWDASARSWLSRANEAKKREQTKLHLVVDNLGIAVDGSKHPYTSVIRAWDSAMQMMDSLLRGLPQAVSTGAVILALSAWHMYPDLLVMGTSTKQVIFKDPLFREGVKVTIGLDNPSSESGDGIHWSLSLAHLLYYGEPQVISRSAIQDASRRSFQDFQIVALGSFCARAAANDSAIISALEILVKVYQKLLSASSKRMSFCRSSSWLTLLFDAASQVLESTGVQRRHALMLMKIGVRRGPSFFGTSLSIGPTFGLTEISQALEVVRDKFERIEFLRTYAQLHIPNDSRSFIKVSNCYPGREKTFIMYSSVRPLTYMKENGSLKRAYIYWVPEDAKDYVVQELKSSNPTTTEEAEGCQCDMLACIDSCQCRDKGQKCDQRCACKDSNCENAIDDVQVYSPAHVSGATTQLSWYNPPLPLVAQAEMNVSTPEQQTVPIPADEGWSSQSEYSRQVELSSDGTMDWTGLEPVASRATIQHEGLDIEWENTILELDLFEASRVAKFERVFGDESSGVFLPVQERDRSANTDKDTPWHEEISHKDLLLLVDILGYKDPRNHLNKICSDPANASRLAALKAFAAAARLYRLLPGATVALQAVSSSLTDARWARPMGATVRDPMVPDHRMAFQPK